MNDICTLTLHGTLGCHLCEQAETIILQVFDANPGLETVLAVALQDIAEDDALIEAYGLRIPVLESDVGLEPLCWPFDHGAVVAYFNTCLQRFRTAHDHSAVPGQDPGL